jgi:hypothetical protein
MGRAFVAILVTSLFAGAPSRAMAQDQGMEVVKKMKDVFEPVRPSIRKVDITSL